MIVLQKVLSLGSDYFSATFIKHFYYKPSKYSPFTETCFCNLFTQSRIADKVFWYLETLIALPRTSGRIFPKRKYIYFKENCIKENCAISFSNLWFSWKYMDVFYLFASIAYYQPFVAQTCAPRFHHLLAS